MTWLADAIDRWGEPRVFPPPPGTPRRAGSNQPCTTSGLPGIDLGARPHRYWRRAWVWFPSIDGKPTNHSLHIDGPVGGGPGRYVVDGGSHHGTFHSATFDHDPTDEDMRFATASAWACCRRGAPYEVGAA